MLIFFQKMLKFRNSHYKLEHVRLVWFVRKKENVGLAMECTCPTCVAIQFLQTSSAPVKSLYALLFTRTII